jgi:hypothetical protein
VVSVEAEVLHTIRFFGPVKISEVCALTNLPRREVEAAVESLRIRGEPIIGGKAGLRLTEDPDELLRYVQARRRRMFSEWRGTRALRRTAKRMREVEDERIGLTLWGAA